MKYNFTILISLFFYCLSIFSQQNKDLEAYLKNTLISDLYNNIERENPIKIIAYDKLNHRIKINYTNLNYLKVNSSKKQTWFITQGEEADNIIEIAEIDLDTKWIKLGPIIKGVPALEIDEKIELFNPFLNYEIVGNKPLLNPYPEFINNEYINYIQAGGIFKNNNDYILLTPILHNNKTKRDLYYAKSNDLVNWKLQNKKVVDCNSISFAKPNGQIFSCGNPLEIGNDQLLVLLGIENKESQFISAFMIIDKDLNIIKPPQQIKFPSYLNINKTNFPLSIIKYEGKYRILFHNRYKNPLKTSVIEVISNNILNTLTKGENILEYHKIQEAKTESGYLNGKADDASYFIFKKKLYLFLGCEEIPSEYLTSLNREYGLLKLTDNQWIHDIRSPLIINPVNLHDKFTDLYWTTDHLGGFISPILKNDFLYLFLTFGSDNPDYYISGIRIKIK